MPPKRKAQKQTVVLPDGLENIIKLSISAGFPQISGIANSVKIVVSNIHGVDYQFHIKGLVSKLQKAPLEIVEAIKEGIPVDNPIIYRLELSGNGSFVNIFAKDSRSNNCKACTSNTKLGRQRIPFGSGEDTLCEQLVKDLSELIFRTQPESKQRKDVTLAEKICENFKILLGGGEVTNDIAKAIESIGNRDYPQLNWDKISTIFVPMLFLPKHTELFDYKKEIHALQKMKETLNIRRARELRNDKKIRTLTDEEENLVKRLKKVDKLEHTIGEYAEKEAYHFLKECIIDEEAIVIHNFKVMTCKDLDEIAEDFEKDFVILNLSRRFIMSLEVKANCNETSLRSAKKQFDGWKDSIFKWLEGHLTEESGWSFYSIIYSQHMSESVSLCDECAKYVIIGKEFKEKFKKMMTEMPTHPSATEEKARKEFKNAAKLLLFLTSYEPVITPAKVTDELVKIIDKASVFEQILSWNQVFCWTPNQLSLIRNEILRFVLFLSQPSSGKTFILKGKAKKFASKGEKVLFLLPRYFARLWKQVLCSIFLTLNETVAPSFKMPLKYLLGSLKRMFSYSK